MLAKLIHILHCKRDIFGVRILTDERIPEIISFVTSETVQKRRHPNENATIIEVEGAPARRIPQTLLIGTARITQHCDPFYTIVTFQFLLNKI